MPTVTVPIKSAWYSKINWIQAVSAVCTFATALISASQVDAATATKLTAAVAGVGQVATWAVRTFFTTSITPSSS